VSPALKGLVESEGYTFVLDPNPAQRPDGLGDSIQHATARVCAGNVLACTSDTFDCAYSAAHEIAEHQLGFNHSVEVFAFQAMLLSRWLKRVAAEASS
jgi:hypothetical protein